MAYKLANKTNGLEKTKYISKEEDVDAVMFFDNLEQLKQGYIAICMKQSQVNELLECFDNCKDFIVEFVDGVFYVVQPEWEEVVKNKDGTETTEYHNGTKQKNIIKKLKRGEVVDF